LEERRGDNQDRELELVRQEATRAGQIVRNLLSFVRRSSHDRLAADLNQIVRTAARSREQHLAHHHISLRLDLDPGVMAVLVNRDEIQQVVLNLVLNAEHAIGDRQGTITIRTQAGEQAHTLEVIDDGPGIDPGLRGRVFEPFFTTKDVGQGTGLGLSIALGVANAHGGSLQLIDRPAGTCFKLTLPAHPIVTLPGRSAAGTSEVPAMTAGPREVHIVEDE
jgi:signal transduction histidine kinase